MIVKAIIEEPEQDQGTHLYLGRSRSAYAPPTDYSRSPPDGRTFFPRQLAQLTNELWSLSAALLFAMLLPTLDADER